MTTKLKLAAVVVGVLFANALFITPPLTTVADSSGAPYENSLKSSDDPFEFRVEFDDWGNEFKMNGHVLVNANCPSMNEVGEPNPYCPIEMQEQPNNGAVTEKKNECKL